MLNRVARQAPVAVRQPVQRVPHPVRVALQVVVQVQVVQRQVVQLQVVQQQPQELQSAVLVWA